MSNQDLKPSTQQHSLPARPPAVSAAFKPRSVGSSASSGRAAPEEASAQYAGYHSQQYQLPHHPYSQNSYSASYSQPAFTPGYGGSDASRHGNGYDPELEAQIAQWQSAYVPKDEQKNTTDGPRHQAAHLSSHELASAKADSGVATVVQGSDGKQKTVVRSGGGQTWQDPSLLEWDPAHFRLFVGNLAGEVTDDSLFKAFSKYDSVQKARVIRDKRTTKSKGYGFVSFSDGDQYFQAAKEMQGKYIGSHPVLLRRSTTEIRPTNPADRNKKGKGKPGHSGPDRGGIKKPAKTRGGLKILG